ncbi:YggS family pyridoxal phosphate-dependent enzyme [soil metagenome]
MTPAPLGSPAIAASNAGSVTRASVISQSFGKLCGLLRWQAVIAMLIAAPMIVESTLSDAAARLADVRQAIAHAAGLAGRSEADVALIAISKTHDAPAIRPLIDAGQRLFGENRVQEAQAKWPALREETPGIALHLVGQLQSNKAAEAVALFDVIHALDRPSLVTALGRAMDAAGRRIPCFVQVNIGAEDQKGGCAIADVPALLDQARAADIPVPGLMCVPPADVEAAPYFALLAKMARDHGLTGLSMGMSGDFETAVMLGATHVRVGTALFGGRPPL